MNVTISLPHVRGGVSGSLQIPMQKVQSSPRTWGCFLTRVTAVGVTVVFPTYVGVFPRGRLVPRRPEGLPHVRGGVSAGAGPELKEEMSSPRTWGCFLATALDAQVIYVFPTYVGVFLVPARRISLSGRLPHVRGGVSWITAWTMHVDASSPRTWGCFLENLAKGFIVIVFPTYVGVFP